MIVVDSSVWIANLRGQQTEEVQILRLPEVLDEVLVGDIILTELLQGARDDRHSDRIEAALRQFPIVNMLSSELAPKAAGHYRKLRARGYTMNKIADLIISTYCIEYGHYLLHNDDDFRPMEEHCGLKRFVRGVFLA